MPYVSTFVYTEDSSVDNSTQGKQRLSLINPQHIFRPAFVPGNFSFSIFFGILDLDMHKEHTLRYLFVAPENEQTLIDSGETNVKPSETESDLPPEMQGVLVTLNFRNVPLRYEGIYNSKVIVDGYELGEFPIYVQGRES
ncbi:MAG: hypothetical protein K9L17_14015 [Clostridiales bacterium]|nr:hypothetical protein [Clostridiales bacterium]MCF8023787.1 hypothetical protein [Clostridiales bacterium]